MLSREYPNYALSASAKQELKDAVFSSRVFFLISFCAACVGLYFFAQAAISESDSKLDNIALIARAVIFVVAKAVLFHYLNKKDKNEIGILFACGAITSIALLAFEIWSVELATRNFIEKPVASYQATNSIIKNCDKKIIDMQSSIASLREKGNERINSKFKHFRETSKSLLAQAEAKETLLHQEMTRCDSVKLNNSPPRFAFYNDAAKFIYAWGSSIIIVLVSDLFAAMAGREKKIIKRIIGSTPPLDDGSDPKGKKSNSTKEELDLPKFDAVTEGQPSPVKAEADNAPVAELPSGTLLEPLQEQNTMTHSEQPVFTAQNAPQPQANQGKEIVKVFSFENTRGEFKKAHEKMKLIKRTKRLKGSADTDTKKGRNLRYRTVLHQVKKGEVRPSIRAIKSAAKCDYNTAAKYLQAMAKVGILIQNENGSYKLAPKKFTPKIVKSA